MVVGNGGSRRDLEKAGFGPKGAVVRLRVSVRGGWMSGDSACFEASWSTRNLVGRPRPLEDPQREIGDPSARVTRKLRMNGNTGGLG